MLLQSINFNLTDEGDPFHIPESIGLIDDEEDDGGVMPMDISEDDVFDDDEDDGSNDYRSQDKFDTMSDSELLDKINEHIESKGDTNINMKEEYDDGGINISHVDPPEIIQRRRFVKAKRNGVKGKQPKQHIQPIQHIQSILIPQTLSPQSSSNIKNNRTPHFGF